MTTTRSPHRDSGRRLGLTLVALLAGMAQGAAQTQESPGMAVSVVNVRRHCFHDRLTASGTFVPQQEVMLRAPRDGFVISEVFVDAGDSVSADQVLARLVSPPGAPQEGLAIKAPIKGTVIAVSAPVGSYASPTTPGAMFRIIGDAGLELRAEMLGSRLSRMQVGMAAKVHVIGLGDLDGQVSSVGSAIDAMTQFGTVSLTVPDSRLRVGAFARADIDVGQDCGSIIPLSALLAGPEGDVVGVVSGERVEMRPVKLGILEGGNVEVREGLRDNEQVIARAGAFLREGDRVHAIPLAALDAGDP